MKRILISVVLMGLMAGGAQAALEEERASFDSGRGKSLLLYEDTSVANTQVVVTTTAKDYARTLREVSVECSASSSITVTVSITRAQITSGTLAISKPDITLTAATSGTLSVETPLMPADLVVVTVPAAGAGTTCTAQILEASP